MLNSSQTKEPDIRRSGVRQFLNSAAASLLLTMIAWAPLNVLPQTAEWRGLIIPAAFLSMPGGLVAALAAMLFSPQGGHGMDDYARLISPVNVVFYYLLFRWTLFRPRGRQDPGPAAEPPS